MRKFFALLIAVALPLLTLAVQAGPAEAAGPLATSCSNSGLASVNGIHLLADPGCTTAVAECPPASAGCAYTASMKMTSSFGVGASRGLLRITNVTTGQYNDFYCGGPATQCGQINPTSYLPAGTRMKVSCSVTKDNVVVQPAVSCSQRFAPLGEG